MADRFFVWMTPTLADREELVCVLDSLIWRRLCEEFHRLDEGTLLDRHYEVDGVEIALATEASTQIDLWVDGAVAVRTDWTEEAEVTLGELRRPVGRLGDQAWNVDVVAELAQ